MKTIKAIGTISLFCLTIIAVIVNLAFVYVKVFDNTETLGVNNINDQLAVDVVKSEDLTQKQIDEYEERYFMVANYYDNSKNNGIELQELRFDYFTSHRLQQIDYRSSGMQYLGDFVTYTKKVANEKQANTRVVEDFYYYDTTNGINWSGGKLNTQLNREQNFIIKIDNKPYAIQLTGKYDSYGKILWWSYKTSTTFYDYGDVFADVFNAIQSNSRGYGDYYITVDLSEYFTIKEIDSNGKLKTDNVTDIIKNYAVLKFHYEANGAKASSQSLFGSIECNSKYDLDTNDFDTSYWQERFVYTLTEKDLEKRFSNTYNASFVSLSLARKELLETLPRKELEIVLDLTNTDIVGLDFNAFENIKLEKLTIKSNKPITFILLEKSLYNTGIKTIERTSNVTLHFSDNAINNEFVGVVV